MWDKAAVLALRKRLGLNQAAFAEALGVSRPTVSEWERSGAVVSALSQGALDRLAAAPRKPHDATADYWRGVYFAAEAMSETVTRLLRQAREASEVRIPAPHVEATLAAHIASAREVAPAPAARQKQQRG